MRKDVICIMCPLGCDMKVDVEAQEVTNVQGHRCKKGVKHAENEIFFPGRILTTTVRTDSPQLPLLPVRSIREIQKDKLIDCARKISEHVIRGPVNTGQVVIEDILGLGIDIVACRTLPVKLPNSTIGVQTDSR